MGLELSSRGLPLVEVEVVSKMEAGEELAC